MTRYSAAGTFSPRALCVDWQKPYLLWRVHCSWSDQVSFSFTLKSKTAVDTAIRASGIRSNATRWLISPWSDFFQCRMSAPHILSLCHLQEHPLKFLRKIQIYLCGLQDLLFIISSFFTIYYSSACLFYSSWFLVHPYHQELFFSFWCSRISSALCYPTKCQMSSFSVFSPKTSSDLAYDWSSPVSFCFFINRGTTHMVIYCCNYYWLILGKLC